MSEPTTRLYLAGPMTGIPRYNFDEFALAARVLRKAGFAVCSPAELSGGDTSRAWHEYMRQDLMAMLGCNGVATLSGWETSRGASLEMQVAGACEIPCRTVAAWLTSAPGGGND